jgi:hypothetical protein
MSIGKDYATIMKSVDVSMQRFDRYVQNILAPRISGAIRKTIQTQLLKAIESYRKRGKLPSDKEIRLLIKRIEREYLASTEYADALADFKTNLDKIVALQNRFFKKHSKDFSIDKTATMLESVMENSFSAFRGIAYEQGAAIRQLLDRQSIFSLDNDIVIKRIEEMAGVSQRRAEFIARQSASLYTGYNDKVRLREFGIKRYKYVGGTFKTTRTECLKRLRKRIYTIEEIRAMDGVKWDGKIPNVPTLVQAGGYNCQHRWQPIFE